MVFGVHWDLKLEREMDRNLIKISSAAIKEKLPQFYRALFSNCQVVVSAADSFFWTGAYGRFLGGLTILQKLPTKSYVGLEVIPEEKIVFAENLDGFVPSENQFKPIRFDSAKEQRLLNFLTHFWPQFSASKNIKGFKIHLLAESHCGGGLGTTGVFLACLAACLMILAGKITAKEIESWELVPTKSLIFDRNYRKFTELFRLAWRLTAISRGGQSSGATSFGAILKTPYPIIYLSEGIHNFINHSSMVAPKDVLDSCAVIEQISFWGGKLEEIFELNLPLPWPVDIGSIFTGTSVNTENILNSFSEIKADRLSIYQFVKKKLAPQIGLLYSKETPSFYLTQSSAVFWKENIDMLNSSSLQVLIALGRLFKTGLYEISLRDFFQKLNRDQDLSRFLGASTKTLDEICWGLNETIAQSNEFQLGAAKIEGVGKGGHVLLMAPAGTLSEEITTQVDRFRKEFKKDIYLDWASWIDGFGKDGLTVEQDLYNHIYSEFLAPGCYRLISYRNSFLPQMEVISQTKISQIGKQYDLVLLCPQNKIMIGGKILSSQDLPSSSATIKILKILLRHPQRPITNQELGQSSYANCRYDLQSKIFIPLTKALKKITNKRLDYKISGGIYDNFQVSVDLKKFKIALLEEVE